MPPAPPPAGQAGPQRGQNSVGLGACLHAVTSSLGNGLRGATNGESSGRCPAAVLCRPAETPRGDAGRSVRSPASEELSPQPNRCEHPGPLDTH